MCYVVTFIESNQKVGSKVALLTCIWEVPVLNIGWETECDDSGIDGFLQVFRQAVGK
jgi:hypothetical protein